MASEDVFRERLKDPTKRKAYYDAMVESGYKMRPFSEFETNIGYGEPVQAENPAQAPASTVPTNGDTELAPQNGTSEQHWTPTEQEKIRMSYEMHFGKDEYVEDGVDENGKTKYKLQHTPGLMETQRKMQAQTDQVKRLAESYTPEGRKKANVAKTAAQVMGLPTKVMGLTPPVSSGKDPEGQTEEAQEAPRFTNDPIPYGVKMVDGKPTVEWLLPDGRLTTSMTEADQSAFVSRHNRLQHQFEVRMKQNGLDVSNEDDVKVQASIDAIQSGIGLDENVRQQIIKEVEDNGLNPMDGEHLKWMMKPGFERQLLEHRLSVAEERLKDLNQRRAAILNAQAPKVYNGPVYPGAVKPSASVAGTAQTPLDRDIEYATAEVAKLSKSLKDYDQNKAAAGRSWIGNLFHGLYEGILDVDTWTFGVVSASVNHTTRNANANTAAGANLLQSYLQSEELLKSAPAAGAVYGGARFTGEIIGDFSTYLSLGFGNIVRKGATKAIAKGGGKKIAGDVAERLATNNKLARYGGAALGHGANFGAFEGLRDIRQQWIDGGYTDDEGNFHEGFSFAHAAQQGIHGFTLGVPMGIFGTWVGNAGNRMVKSVDNIAGKAAIKGGQFGLSVVGEGTIFASKEIADFLTMQDDKFDELYAEHYGYDKETDPQKRANARAKARAIISWDAWTQSAANIFGMKVAGKISHPGQLIGNVKSTIAELRRDGARHGMNFREKVKMMLDRSPLDIKLTKEEREELKRFGYGDLADIFVKEGEQGKNGVEVGNLNETSRTPVGDPNGGMDLVTGDFKQSEYDGYATMEKLMNDKRVSEASRAKLYFILTGKMLPMSTITGWNMVESEDGQTFSINSYNSEGGVVTSKTFRYDSKSAGADSQREVARIKRQVELNTVNVGEQLADVAATKKIAERAFKSVGAKHNLIPEAVSYIYDRYEKGEHLSEAEAAIIADINTIVEGNLEYGASLRPAAFKERIKEEYDVDVDKALLKEPEKRTDAERNAIADYMDMLYHEADRDRMAREVWGQEYEQMRDEEKAARRRAYRMQMDGRLLAEGKPEDPTEADRMGAEAIYEEAKQTFDKVEQGNPEAQAEVDAIGLRVQEAWTLCEEAFGDQADYWMFHVENDPWRLINDPALTADQQEAVLYYINSKAAMDGVLDASNEASDRKRAEVENTITARTHRDLKQIIPATMKVDDRQVYVVKGNVTMHEDGSAVDVRNSDQSVVVMDAETGKLEFSSPDRIFKLGEAIDPAQELETAYAAIQAEQDAMLGNNTGGPKTGESVPKTTENGGSDAENVHKPVSTVGNGQEGKPLTKDEEAAQHVHNSLEGAIVDQWGKAMDDAIERTGIEWLSNPKVKFIFGEYAKGCKSIEEVAERAIADQDDPRTAQRIKNLLKFKSTRALLERLLPKSNDTEGAPQSALSRIPTKTVGKEEEPDFTAVDKATALDGLMEAAGGNEKLATDIILAQVKQSREDVEALKKKPPTKKQPKLKGSPMAMLKANEQAEQEYAEAMTQYKADLAEKERIMQAWYDISSELSRRNSEARAAREAEQQARNIQAHDEAQARFEEEQRIKAEKAAEQERVGTHAVNPKITEKWNAATKVEGDPDVVALPDGSQLKGRYVLTDAGSASASHDANNAYLPTEGFPIDENGQSVNDRDYQRDKDAQSAVEKMAAAYDHRALQSPVVVSKDGVVLSGNNRTMSGDLAATGGTDKAYNDYLREYGHKKYGFTPEQIAGFKHPRVVFVPDDALPYDAKTFARFNEPEKKSMSKPEEAVKKGKTVPDSVFADIVGDIARYDRLSDFYNDEKAVAAALGGLHNAGIIPEMDMPKMRTGTAISAAGKEEIENTLLGKAFQAFPDAVRQILSTPTMRENIIVALPEIAANRALTAKGYDLSEELGRSVDLVARAKSALPNVFVEGVPVSPFGRQQGLFDDEFGESRVKDASTLMLADLLNSKKSTDLRKVLAVYNRNAQSAASGQLTMQEDGSLTIESREDILKQVNQSFINATPKELQALVDKAIAANKQRAGENARAGSEGGKQAETPVQRSAEPQRVSSKPTEAQKEAGNYKMEHRRIDGYNVSIENPKGSVRRGKDADGKAWETEMQNDYGYIRGTEGVDGDHIDVFLSDTPEEGDVFVVDQINPETGKFDEHKVMYGFPDMESAKRAYLSNYSKGWQGLGTITHVSKADFKKWIQSSTRKTKPFADYKTVKKIENAIGRPLTKEEATSILNQMQSIAEDAPDIKLTPYNWVNVFGESGIVPTPLGDVKMGDNQFQKLIDLHREEYFGMIRPTLNDPHVIIEKDAPAEGAERDTKYLFVKTFKKPNGGRYVHFESVTVRKEGMEDSISNHEADGSAIKKEMQDEKVLHLNKKLSLSSERYLTEASGDPKGPDLVPTSDNVSSEGKVTTLSSDKQEKAPESSEGYTLEARKDTRDNSDLYAVKFEERVSKDEFKGQKAIAKKHGGYWSNFGKKGFLFKTEQEARDFANEVLGKTEDAVADEAPLTTQDIRNIVEPLAEEPKAAKPKRTAPAKPKPANTATVEDIKPTPATEPEKPAEEPKKEYNVSDEEMNSLLGDIRDLLGIDDTSDFKFRDPDDMSKEDLFKLKLVGIRFAMAIVERGNPKFEDYARLMVKNLGDKIRPWVKQFYGGLYFEPGFDTSVLTPFEEVQAFDIANFEKPDNNPFREAETIAAEQKAKKADEKATKEITEIRNQNRKKEDEQTSADTAALASEAETVAGEAESVAETSASEPELNGAAERIDAALEKVNDQLALLGYYEADPNAPEHEIYGRRRSAEKKAVKDATKLAQQLVDDLGMDFTKANLTEPDRHGRMKIKPLAVANVAPAGGDIVINLPYPDGRNLHINIGIVPTHEKGVEPKRGGGAWEGDNYEVDSIMFRFEDDSHSGHNRFLPADVTYSNLLDAIKKESRWGMTKAEAETKSSEQVMSELGDMLERGESPYTVTPEVESELAKQREGEYKPGEKVLYSSDDGRTWEDATVEGMDGDMITLDTGHAPIMYVNAYPEQVRRPQQGGVQPREDIFQEANRIAKETQEKKKSVSSRKKPKVKPEQPVADLFGGLFDQPNDNEQDTSNSGGQAVANAERPNTVGNDATGVDGGERPLGSGRTDGEQSTDGSRAAVGDRADADAHATGSVGTLRKPGGNRGRNESGTAGAVSKPVDGGGTAGAGSTRGQGADGGAEAVSEGKPAAGTRAGGRPSSVKKPKHKFTRNFNYEEVGNDADHYTPPQRLEANVSAVETIAKIIREGDRPATDEEKLILSRFRGWGQVDFKKYYSLSHIKQNTRHNDPLHRLATAIESIDPKDDKKLFDAIKTASLTAFYTPVPVAAAMNSFLPLAGFHGGSMLDPSTGNGIFEGTLSKALQERTMITGIELDWLTARIARALYPDADIRINGYESAGITPGSMDVVTTNMPFGDTTIYDPTWKSDSSPIKRSAQKRIHNYFAVKMLESARPGGLVSMMTTTSVMDTKSNQNVRMHIAEQGEILGAIRLPGDVFQGTGAVSDIIYVRKWRDNEDAQATRSNPAYAELERAFLSLHETTAPNKRTGEPRKVAYNGYYKMHPDHMLGEVVAGNQYGDDGFGLRGTRTVDEIAAEIKDINMKIVGDRVGQLYNPTRTVREVHEAIGAEYKGDGDWVSNGNLVVQDGKIGELTTATNKYGEVTRTFVEKPGLSSQRKKVESMIELRTAMKELIAAQIEGKPDNILDMMRRKLKGAYDRFTAKNGKLKANDFLLEDIDGYTLQGLEKWEDGKFVGLADIFTKNTIKPALRLEDASTPQEAIATSLAEYGELRGEYMEKVLGEGWHDQCKDYVFEVPNSDGRFVTKDEYLSGDVVSKLQEAKAASMLDPRFENNVKALEEVQPTPIPFDDIAVHLGARWIPIEMINDFVKELFGIHASSSRNRRWVNGEMVEELKSGVVYVPEMDTYIVNIEPKELGGEATDWETGARSAKQVLEAALSDKTLTVSKTDSKGNKFLDEEATELVNQKVQDMRERFEQWLSTDDARMEAISEAYNERFNRTVLRKWDGSHLNIPGLMGKELRPHQKDAVWMLINNRGGIVDHIVGAGKTLVMQAAIMEMRRMGIAKKPMIVALKSTVGQIAREFKCAFPSARVLAPSDKDFEMSNRKKFIANIALNDYDCVILSHEQYCKLPHTEEAEQVVIQEQLAQLDAIIQYLYGTGDKSQLTKKQIKALEKRRENLLAKMKQRLDRSVDREFCFEDLGVDYLFVDECHQFRSLPYVTSYNQVAGLGPAEGSNKAVALLTGMRYLQKMHQGDKGTIFLSGTTINNSLVEIYNLLNYLRPRKLEALGMTTFDAWASTFAVHSAEIEAGTTGEFKSKDRFRSFDNVPELSQLYAEIADVRNDMNLQLPKPAIDARTVIVKESDALHEINQAIIDMLNTKNGSYFGIYPKGEPRKHPWGLDASTLSAKAAISPKLIFPDIEDDGGKIASVCENVGKIFKETAEHKGVQLIFCELGVPGPGKKYDAYTDMINRLSKEYGIPRKAIAYIQQAKNDKEKEELFQRVRNGEVRILIGGTKNMGTGVNVQDRITDLHMLSVPWQPASLEQCIGRGARQGNIIARDFMGNKVRVHYYATEGSLDLYKFQLLDAKGKMFTQFKMGTISGDRNFDEGSSDENGNLDPAEMVAILSGNPVIFEKSKQDKLVKKLKAAYNGFLRDVQRKKVKRAQLQESIEKFDRLVTISDRDVDKLKRGGFTPDEEGRYPSRVTVKVKGEYRGETFDKPKECGEFILENLKENKQLTLEGYGFEADVVFVAGDDLLASAHYEVQTGKEGFWGINYTKRLSEDATAAGCAFRSLLEQIISNNAAYKNGLAEKKRLLETMPEPSDVFPKQKELDEAVAKKRELDAEYNKLAKPDTPQDAATGDKFRLRTSEPPKRTGIGYKVFVLKDGKLYPPMVANADRSETPTGVWLDADPNEQFIIGGKEAVDAEFAHVEPWLRRYHVQAGGKGTQGGSGKLAFRPGWHLGQIPFAAQFGRVNPETGEKELFPNNFVWAKVEYAMDEDYQHESDERMYYDKNGNRREKPTHSLGGLNHVPENGYYTYRTNPDPTTDPWIITGAMRVIEIMKPSEVDRVVSEAGRAPQLRQEGAVTDAEVEALNRDLRKRMDTDGTSMSIRVREIAEELHTPVELITTPEEIKQLPTVRHQNAKGWFKDGKVYVVVPNNTNVADVENTAIHEIVGHKGLRELVGEEHFNLFLDEIYDHASDRIKADINKRAEKAFDDEVNRLRLKYGNGYFGEAKAKSETYAKREQIKRDATEEYMCDMAGKIGHDGFKKMQEDELTLWGKIKAKFMKFMDKILKGLRLSKGVKFTDKDIAYILFKSWQKAKGKTGIFAEAEDIAMRNATHFNESEEAMRFRWFGKKKSVNLQHGKEGTEQNQSIGHNRSEQAKGNERGGVSAPVSGGLATGTDRSSIRVFEEGLAAHRERHSDYSTRERQEAEGERLIAIAKEKGLFFTKEQVKDFGEKVRQLSRESDVYINHSEGRVYKVKNPYANAGTWKNNLEPEDAIYEFLLHNKYFPNTAYKFEGIAEDADGVRIVLSQPYVEARHQASDEEVDAYLAAKGLKKEAWYTYGNEEVIVSDCVDENALIGQDGDLYIIDPVIDVRKPILELIGPFEPDTDGGAHFRDGDMSLQEAITKLKLDIASAQGDNAKAKEVAVRAIGSNLQELRKAMSRQRLYDLQTVKSMTDLAQLLMEHNMLDDMSKYEVSRILSAVKNSPGHISKDKDTGELRASGGEKNLQHQVDSLLDLMVNNQLRKAQNSLSKLLSVQGSKVDARGVKVQGELDAEGVIIARTLKHNLGVPAEIYDAKGDLQPGCIKWAMQEVMDKMGDADARVAERAAMEYAGLQIAMQYANDITKSKAEEKLIKDSLNTLKENKEGGKIDAKAYSQAVEAVYDSLRANKLERAEAYFRIVDSVAGVLGESIERAKAWREEQKQRVRDIQHNCNSDMEGRVLRGQRKDDRLDGIVQSTICRIFLEPLATFDQMLRMLGGKNANGEGYLWNRYMHGWTSAAEREQVMKERNHHNMDEAAADIFGKGKKWGYVYDLNRALPKSTVTIWDGGEMREHELTQLDLLTILIWDAQPTGRATLRNMGIDEVKIGEIENFLDPRMRHLGDWMVGYLSGRYQDYNEVYKRLFGAPMTANENYFPFRRFKDEIKREVENGTPADNDHSSITTGAVKERKFSLVSFDIVNSNAADIFTRHLDEMEHWSSFAELNRDIGIMLSYNRLKQQVQQMHTAYGSGKTLWNRFEKCCAIATESYEPKVGNFDKLFVKATKGVAMGKVNLRLFTALKQTLSLPAFLPDCHIGVMSADLALGGVPAVKWAWKNMPLYRKRVLSRTAGDYRLKESEYDTKLMRLFGKGMLPNIGVDAWTIAIGAHAVYKARYNRYRRYGMPEKEAEARAIRDAEISFNESQQSSEGPFLAPIQVDHTAEAFAYSLFRNSAYSYTRKTHEAARNLRNLMSGNSTVEYMTKQLLRDLYPENEGAWSDDQVKHCEAEAKRQHRRAYWKNAVQLGTFGWILPWLWRLGGIAPLLLLSSDDDERDKAARGALLQSTFGPFEGLAGGDVITQAANMALGFEEPNWKYISKQSPMLSDVADMLNKLGKDNVTAMNDILNIVVGMNTGLNPASITDMVVAVMDYCESDKDRRECALLIARILNCPPSQMDKVYFDELDLSAKEASAMTPDEIAERYARYKMRKDAPLTGWLRSQEAEDTIHEAKKRVPMMKAKERLQLHTNTEETRQLLSRYDAITHEQTEIGKLKKTDRAEYLRRRIALREGNDMREHRRIGRYKRDINELTQRYLRAKTTEERDSIVEAMIAAREKMLDDLNSYDMAEE